MFPIKFVELFQKLPDLGINPQAIGFSTLTMESEKYICIKETQDGNSQIVIIDIAKRLVIDRRLTVADSVLMNPEKNILALRASSLIQIFDVEMKSIIKEYQIQNPIVFWKWVNANTLAIVSNTAVYHWNLKGNLDPVKMFDRHSNLSDCQIINYKVDDSLKWLLLVGLAQRNARIVGAMQLFSVEKQVTQPIEGHVASFVNFTPDGSKEPFLLFTFAKRTDTEAKLYIMELGNPNSTFQKKAIDIDFPPEAIADFPIFIQISEKYNIIFVITNFGYLHMFDLESGAFIFKNRISTETIFVTCNHKQTGGVLTLDRKGRLLLISVDEENIISYITDQLNNYELAMKIASRCGLKESNDLLINQFNQLMKDGKLKEAAKIAADSPNGILRTKKIIQLFQQMPTQPGQPSPVLQYFQVLFEKGKLNAEETIELAKLLIQQGRKELLQIWLTDEKLVCSEELGDMVKPLDLKLALTIYSLAGIHLKVVLAFAEIGEIDSIVPYCQGVGYKLNWDLLLEKLTELNPFAAEALKNNLNSNANLASNQQKKNLSHFKQTSIDEQATDFIQAEKNK